LIDIICSLLLGITDAFVLGQLVCANLCTLPLSKNQYGQKVLVEMMCHSGEGLC